jgi:hypothetical protein
VKICCTGLTTCGVLKGGQGITLGLLDESGAEVTLQLPFDHAQAVAMTLPGLLTRSLRSLTGDESARYVFDLNSWLVEQSKEREGLVLTLGTPDGFQVTFAVPAEACRSLGWTLSANAVSPPSLTFPMKSCGPDRRLRSTERIRTRRYFFQPCCHAGGVLPSMRMKAIRHGLPLLLTQA